MLGKRMLETTLVEL